MGIFNSKMMRNIATNVNSRVLDESMASVKSSIKDAASKGEVYVYYYSEIHPNICDELKSLGFDIDDRSCQREGVMYMISWATC